MQLKNGFERFEYDDDALTALDLTMPPIIFSFS